MYSFIPSATHGGVYPYRYLGHPMDCISAHSAVGITVNPLAIPDAQAFHCQRLPLLDHSWSGIPAHTHDRQFNTEVGLLVGRSARCID